MKKGKMSAIGLAIFALAQIATPVMAANPYGIEYTGGEELGAGNVVESPGLIDKLTPIITPSEFELTFSGQWEDGFASSTACRKVKYFTVSEQNLFNNANNYSYSMQSGQYRMDVKIKNVVGEYTASGNTYMVGVGIESGMIFAGYDIFTNSNCGNIKNDINRLTGTGDKIFVETDIKIYKEGQTEVFTSDELYFALTDIDSSQSYKILNSADKLTAGKMYAKSLSGLQSTDPNDTGKNMFSPTGNYIYSSAYPDNIDLLLGRADIFVNISKPTQLEGLDLVFGFAQMAGSGVEYYAKQYTVTYESDEGGTITGITDEQVISGDTPFGSTEESKENYELDYWKADKDVTLTDGTTIKAGEPITIEQIKKVVVNEDLTFTAIHKAKVKVPDTGAFTEDINGMLVSLPVIGILLGALILGLLPKLTHKKISFKK